MKKILAIFIVISLTVSSANAFVINWLLIAVGVIPATVVGIVQTSQIDMRINKRIKKFDKQLEDIVDRERLEREKEVEKIANMLDNSMDMLEKITQSLDARIHQIINERMTELMNDITAKK
jgi:uncharacterized protein YicC (UPF0701 family)